MTVHAVFLGSQHRCFTKLKTYQLCLLLCLLQSVHKVVRAHPYVLAVSFLAMAAVMTAGVLGVLAAADSETRHRRASATGAFTCPCDVMSSKPLLHRPSLVVPGPSQQGLATLPTTCIPCCPAQ